MYYKGIFTEFEAEEYAERAHDGRFVVAEGRVGPHRRLDKVEEGHELISSHASRHLFMVERKPGMQAFF